MGSDPSMVAASCPDNAPPLADQLELSVVLPCLNEAETLARCVEKARRTMQEQGIRGEVIVADNGSSDGSREIAERMHARVVQVEETGYGNALLGGIAAARGKYVIMGDADESYDFSHIPRFLEKLRDGIVSRPGDLGEPLVRPGRSGEDASSGDPGGRDDRAGMPDHPVELLPQPVGAEAEVISAGRAKRSSPAAESARADKPPVAPVPRFTS